MKELKEVGIEEIEGIEEHNNCVYTLEVENNHNYFINSGILSKNSIVVIDELQNLSRQETRTILSRMGENTRCFCTGDVTQVDVPHLNHQNNGLNWLIKLFTGKKNYGHITLKGKRSRGPIADLVNETGL